MGGGRKKFLFPYLVKMVLLEIENSFCSGLKLKTLDISEKMDIGRSELMHSDEELAERFTSGEVDSFRVLVERYKSRVYNIAYGIMRSRDEAEDLTQEVFIKVYRNLHHFKGKSRFYTWLYRIAVNVCLSAKRKRGQFSHIVSTSEFPEVGTGRQKIELTDETYSPQKVSGDMELASQIQSAINSLPGVLEMTFILREFEDLSYRELARIFRCSSGTIKSRLARAREKLRQKLTPYLKV